VVGGKWLRGVAVRLNRAGLCNVQRVGGMKLIVATRTLGRVSCRVGKVTRTYSKRVRKGRVISQMPKFGAVLQAGGKVNLVISKGRKH
jgi:beta-lactam-binding protein with PASTA domain